jgi:hypothetical protein
MVFHRHYKTLYEYFWNIKQNYFMIQWFHFWVCTQKNLKQEPDRLLYTHIYSSITHGSQKVEATHVSIHRWTYKQNVVDTYNGILFSINKEDVECGDTRL